MTPERQKIEPMNPLTAWGLLGLVLLIIWLGGYRTISQYAIQQKHHLSQANLLAKKQQTLVSRAESIETALTKAKRERQTIKFLVDGKEGNPIPAFQSLIRKLAKDSQIKLTKIQMPKINKGSHLEVLSIRVEGFASIKNVRDFLIKTNFLKPLIRIDSLELVSVGRDANNTRLNISLKASALMDNKAPTF